MKRREFTKLLSMAGLSAVSPWLPNTASAAEPYSGPFYISLAAIGGWDVTSFCDPKLNQPGQRDINTWASSADIQQIGNITYAPVAKNQEFFERFYQDMLVINGLDTQTNSHDDGRRHTWSGRIGFGYPSFGAIASAAIAPDLALSLVHDSGYSETAGITRFSRLQNPDLIRNLVNDSKVFNGASEFDLFEPSELDLITQYQDERLNRLMASNQLLPRQEKGMNNLFMANSTRDELKAFADLLPDTFEEDNDFRAAQLALLAYQSGLCVSAQLGINGFDTHQNHDTDHFEELEKLTNLVTFIFDTAEQAGFADKIILTMSSDFGRTPYYNAGGGKDHWPIGSAIMIQQGASWGNRVVGATDGVHQALNINPSTLQVDNSSAGIRLEPKHLQQAMRQLGGVDNSNIAQMFPLNAENIDFFNPAIQTG
ncbi:MAG: hypothetical protein COA96_14425 [SAR86 cluster bacterium]|uniref:Tat pathway signal protein n=1 Tax=SAR86 cluster bacterium TaxID=2030880 RepID=A0A2A5AT36_9GAMM|nr:MAG: hypothetical protein COA96_14425 [SAR86 cluster bacterium]